MKRGALQKTGSIFTVSCLLLGLLALTMGFSGILSGPFGLTAGLAIALAKAGLLGWRFMHLDEQPGLARIAAMGAAVWLTIPFAMTGLDYLTR